MLRDSTRMSLLPADVWELDAFEAQKLPKSATPSQAGEEKEKGGNDWEQMWEKQVSGLLLLAGGAGGMRGGGIKNGFDSRVG